MKQWKYLREEPFSPQATVQEIVDQILVQRGFVDPDTREQFLHPSLSRVSLEEAGISPVAVARAIERIRIAIAQKEPITVYTDYDVDGVSAGTIIWETLHRAGANVLPYIPHREREGYGLSEYGIQHIAKEHRTRLLITVDHGITAAAKIKKAKELGMDTIILDHHVLPETIPEAVAIVHTTQLCAGGISWLFSSHLRRSLGMITSDAHEREYLDLAALATIADLVPLTHTNRILVSHGLAHLRMSERVGLRALIDDAGITASTIGVYEVGHLLAPRINAMGRLTHALDALRLMCTKDRIKAQQLAKLLGDTNRERQQLTEEATRHALDAVTAGWTPDKRVIIVADPSYNQGIIGLVAGRLAQEFHRPAIALSQGPEFSKASARSIPGWNIVEMIRKAEDLLVDVGGHPMAAGFTIPTANLPAFIQRMEDIAVQEMAQTLLLPTLFIDGVLSLPHMSTALIDTIDQLSPFGMGNAQPVFASLGVRVIRASTVGREGKHLKMMLRDPHAMMEAIDAIGFGMGDLLPAVRPDTTIDVAYVIERNTWNGISRLQLKLRDVRIA